MLELTVAQRREMVASAIEQNPEKFNMFHSHPTRQYIGCIAAFCIHLFPRDDANRDDIIRYGARILGMEDKQFEKMFCGMPPYFSAYKSLYDITAKEAAALIRNLPNA